MEREKERLMKLPPSIVFDYLKGFIYKIQNENDEMRQKLEKEKIKFIPEKFMKKSDDIEEEQYYKTLRDLIERLGTVRLYHLTH